jgi:hypothetical protein
VGLAPESERLSALLSSEAVTAQLTLYQPAPLGLACARRAVAAYCHEAHGRAVDPDDVILTSSTSEGYAYLFKLLCDPDDEVAVPTPSYPLLDELARCESVRLVRYELEQTDRGWLFDTALVERALTSRTRAVVAVSPNNPTGTLLTPAERARVGALCAERGIPLIIDEVFADYVWQDPPPQAAGSTGAEEALTVILSGLSKVVGLPQLKLGWMVLSGPSGRRAALRDRLELVADAYLSVATPIQLAAPGLLAHWRELQAPIRERVGGNREWLLAELAHHASGLRVQPVVAGWSAIVELPRWHSDEEWTLRLLERASVYVQPGYFFDLPREGHCIVSLLTRPAALRRGIHRLIDLVQEAA